jgi:tRNA dimethylallyltransferase
MNKEHIKDLELLGIVGQTATGKTSAAIEVAKSLNGEIICADSRTVYKGMDILTAKPTATERALVPHHLLDIVEPCESFTVADFKELALDVAKDIRNRGKLPIVVGGSGLYVDALFYDFSFRPSNFNVKVRQDLEKLSVEELQDMIVSKNLPKPENFQNRRHLTRVLESGGLNHQKRELPENRLILGIKIERELLKARVEQRVEAMYEQGLIEEVEQLLSKYGANKGCDALKTPGVNAVRGYLDKELDLTQSKELFVRADMQLAKRQRTWFKRNQDIVWFDSSKALKSWLKQ